MTKAYSSREDLEKDYLSGMSLQKMALKYGYQDVPYLRWYLTKKLKLVRTEPIKKEKGVSVMPVERRDCFKNPLVIVDIATGVKKSRLSEILYPGGKDLYENKVD